MDQPSLNFEVRLPDGGLRRLQVSEDDVRAVTGHNIFYDVDAFIQTGFKRLGMDFEVVCTPRKPEKACHVVRVGKWANSTSHRWRLIRDGHRDDFGINNVNWMGVKTLRYEYRETRQTP